MRTIRLVALHDARILLRNTKLLAGAVVGVSVPFFLVLANAKQRPAEEMLGLLFFLFVGVAVAVPVSVAVHSLVGEKERRTMEPLLLLPISIESLVAGKAVVTLALSLAGLALVFLLTAVMLPLGARTSAPDALYDVRTLYVTFVLAPLTVVPFTLLALAISARSPDSQTASASSFLFLTPLWVVLFGVWMGFIGVNQHFLLASTLTLVALCVLAFRVAVRSLDPERMVRRRQ
jgi:ABC-type Na+ efflux pump permease subunit